VVLLPSVGGEKEVSDYFKLFDYDIALLNRAFKSDPSDGRNNFGFRFWIYEVGELKIGEVQKRRDCSTFSIQNRKCKSQNAFHPALEALAPNPGS
jgi:hypothetical protein